MSYLVRARLRRDAGGSDGALIKLVAESGATPGRHHDLVWTLFGESAEQPRDFVFRVDHDGGLLTVTAYAPRRPGPRQARIWDVVAKPFAPRLYPGERIRFSLRANPVRQQGNSRVDAVYDAFARERTEAKASGNSPPERLQVAHAVGREWLARRAPRLGLRLDGDTVAATAYETARVIRPGGKPFTLSILDLTGEAEVTDPQALTRGLPAGIGKGKAYGCGMMLIART